MENIKIICKDCGKEFDFVVGEQKFFAEKGLANPVRCKECRTKRKVQAEESKDKTLEDMLKDFEKHTIKF